MRLSDFASRRLKIKTTQLRDFLTEKQAELGIDPKISEINEKEANQIYATFQANDNKKTKTEIAPKIIAKKKNPISSEKEKFQKINLPIIKIETITKIDEDLDIEEEKPKDTAELYDQLLEREREEEIREQQKVKLRVVSDVVKKVEEKPKITLVRKTVELPPVISVREFAEKLGLPAAKIVAELLKSGVMATLNEKIDFDTAAIIAMGLGATAKKKHFGSATDALFHGNLKELLKENDESKLVHRPPVVVVMGHVDHGKTKLLDTIRKTNVAGSESGGITQHIGAYQIEHEGQKITFLDTPGHEAFTAMRARGAQVTDIAILVVAAEEGIKPTTVEAINHAKNAKIPIIVAINKIDKPGANIEKVKSELAEQGLNPEEWGGDTLIVPISALTGEGLPKLLETILLVTEMQELKANFDRLAIGTVIESHLDPHYGPVATVLVNTGTLKVMDNIIIGGIYGRIRHMADYRQKRLKKAGPSCPVQISGLSGLPQTGDILQVMPNEKLAKEKALEIAQLQKLYGVRGLGREEITKRIAKGEMKELNIVLKADFKGSLEAIKNLISGIKSQEISVRLIYAGVGNITEGDVLMASAANGIVVGFHTLIPPQSAKIAEREKISILIFDIIYELVDNIKQILSGLLEPEIVEKELGRLKVKAVFWSKKNQMIIGGQVMEGKIKNKAKVRILHNNEIIGEGKISSLKREKENVNEVLSGHECGMKVESSVKAEEGDILEIYEIEKIERTIE